MLRPLRFSTALIVSASTTIAFGSPAHWTTEQFVAKWVKDYAPRTTAKVEPSEEFRHALSEAAVQRTHDNVRYEAAYVGISYPGGDVPADTGVCSDEVIRAYRRVGVDLQAKVHEDMSSSFPQYPPLWGLDKPDSNIDHRRVPNLMRFFARHGATLPVSADLSVYEPGDVVAWQLSNGLLHIGMVVEPKSADGARHLVVHNIGQGPKLEDALGCGKVLARFRYGARRKS